MQGESSPRNGQSTSEASRTPVSVLCVDDNSDILELTATYLERNVDEFTIVTATSVSEGLDRLDRDSIDCIVSDYEMPDQSGLAFLQTVREEYPEIPFILFTGRGSEEIASRAISAGVTDYVQKATGSDQYDVLANRIRNAVKQYRTEQNLKNLQRRYEGVARASADAFVDWDIQTDYLWWSEGLRRTFGYTPEEVEHAFEWWETHIHPEDSQRVCNALQNAFANQEELFEVEHRFRRADGTYAHVIGRGYIVYADGDPVRTNGVLIDITEREEREQTLAQLHQVSRELIQAETTQAVCDIATRVAHEVLELSGIGLYLWDESEGVLRPQALTRDTEELLDEVPTFTPGSSLAWDVFLEGDTRVFADVRDHENIYNQETAIRSELIVPLGEYGVFISGSTSIDAFTDNDVQFVETLAANTTAALQRADREQDLHEKEQVLQEQNTTLSQLHRVNTILRAIQRDVVEATTRDAIEQAVCNDLVRADQYQFAWIGSTDESEQLSPSAWAGAEDGYLDELRISSTRSDAGTPSPARQALETGETVVVQRLRTQLDERPWLKEAFDCGFQSLIAIPLVFKESVYGVVEIYADQPTTFIEDEQEMLREVCDFVANALNAVERRQALVTESNVELEFHIEDVADVLFRLARHAECTLDLNSLFPQPGGEWLLYITVSEGDGEAILEVAEQLGSINRVTRLEDDTFEVSVSNIEIATVLGEQGATLHSLQAGPEGGYIVVHLPQTANVRSFVDACTSVFPDAELIRRNRIASDRNADGVKQGGIDRLTDRQRDVLEIAYRNGFFEWPRESTGEEVAERLDVSPPTFHRHVRKGTHKLLDSFFE